MEPPQAVYTTVSQHAQLTTPGGLPNPRLGAFPFRLQPPTTLQDTALLALSACSTRSA